MAAPPATPPGGVGAVSVGASLAGRAALFLGGFVTCLCWTGWPPPAAGSTRAGLAPAHFAGLAARPQRPSLPPSGPVAPAASALAHACPACPSAAACPAASTVPAACPTTSAPCPACPSAALCPAAAPPPALPSPCPSATASLQPVAPCPVADACTPPPPSIDAPGNASLWGAFAAGYWESDTAALWRPVTSFPPAPNASVHVLVIGDSVDRLAARDLCAARGRRSVSWAEDVLPYDSGFASVYCDLGPLVPGGPAAPSSSWAMLHHFGAAPTGPYLDGFANGPSNRFADTRLRLPRGLEHYQRVFGRRPTHVVYQANLWDVSSYRKRYGSNTTHLGAFLRAYASNLAEAVRSIWAALGLLPPQAGAVGSGGSDARHGPPLVLLRTSVSLDAFAASANAVMAAVAAQLGVPLLDWAGLVATWAARSTHGALFRDSHHPTADHTLIFSGRLVELAAAEQPGRGPLPPVVDVQATPSPAPTLGGRRRQQRRRGRRRARRQQL